LTFNTLRIDLRFERILRARGIVDPTPIQTKAIPVALAGQDLVAIAQTGTGKTLAFGLPALMRLADMPRGATGMLILVPTRELARQVDGVLQPFAKTLGLTTACVYGGVGMEGQTAALRRGASIVVACPGRLLDHMHRGNVRFDRLSILVLDEADRMLDMGFLPDIRRILGALPRARQTMMFSATFPAEIAQLAGSMMQRPHRLEAGPVAQPLETVRQGVFTVARDQKMDLLRHILRQGGIGPTLVFLRTKRTTDRVAKALIRDGFSAEAIHGGLSQGRRTQAIDGFRSGRHRVLIATDVAARGLDVKGISHVVNYDIPGTPDDYIHRIGRTARAHASGDAITFVTPDDTEALRDIERALGKRLERTVWSGPASHSESRHSPARPQTRPMRTGSQPRRASAPTARANRGQTMTARNAWG
jgi:ATP-dependent RNA helicase RhlE